MTQNQDKSVKQWFGGNLAKILAQKISAIYPSFDKKSYILAIENNCENLNYTARIELHADILHKLLPQKYCDAIAILIKILGDENPHETGMFKHFYWVMPISKFIEKYGLQDFAISLKAIEEITKRSTGEYAIRPFIKLYPAPMIEVMQKWSKSDNFHLRRLACEGLRPKLPWAKKLDIFIENPTPVFVILENLMQDKIKFVQKSVANHLIDYVKVNKDEALRFIKKFEKSSDKNTIWILKQVKNHPINNLKN